MATVDRSPILHTRIETINDLRKPGVHLRPDDTALVSARVVHIGTQHGHHIPRDLAESLRSGISFRHRRPDSIEVLPIRQSPALTRAKQKQPWNRPLNPHHHRLAHKRMLADTAFDRQREHLLARNQRDAVVQAGDALPGVGDGWVRGKDVLGAPRAGDGRV